jgi:hypothetical protein
MGGPGIGEKIDTDHGGDGEDRPIDYHDGFIGTKDEAIGACAVVGY